MRLHLVELHDLSWFPSSWRNLMTEFLRQLFSVLQVYDRTAPLLARTLDRLAAREIIDLCSGGAGPWARLAPMLSASLGREVSVTLTDLFPNLPAFESIERNSAGTIGYCPESVDATNLADDLSGVRTIFSAFHHFRPEMARRILEDV